MLGAGTAGAVVLLSRGGSGTDTATASDPSTDPFAGPSVASDTITPAAPTTPVTPSSPPAPRPSASEPELQLSTKPLSYQEFDDDWNFRLGDVRLFATFRSGTDFDGCGPAENAGALTRIGCTDATEWTYRALGGKLALSHLVLTMRSPAAATRAVEAKLITEKSWRLRDDSFLTGRDGYWKATSVGQFVVITVETHDASVRTKQASKFLDYANADIRGALGFRT